jgi:hypothetical protein
VAARATTDAFEHRIRVAVAAAVQEAYSVVRGVVHWVAGANRPQDVPIADVAIGVAGGVGVEVVAADGCPGLHDQVRVKVVPRGVRADVDAVFRAVVDRVVDDLDVRRTVVVVGRVHLDAVAGDRGEEQIPGNRSGRAVDLAKVDQVAAVVGRIRVVGGHVVVDAVARQRPILGHRALRVLRHENVRERVRAPYL